MEKRQSKVDLRPTALERQKLGVNREIHITSVHYMNTPLKELARIAMERFNS